MCAVHECVKSDEPQRRDCGHQRNDARIERLGRDRDAAVSDQHETGSNDCGVKPRARAKVSHSNPLPPPRKCEQHRARKHEARARHDECAVHRHEFDHEVGRTPNQIHRSKGGRDPERAGARVALGRRS